MTDECSECGEYAARGCTFCGSCGRGLAGPGKTHLGFAEIILVIACVAVMLIAAFETLVMIWNSGDVFYFLSSKSYGLILIVPFPHEIFTLRGGALQAYWILLDIIIIFCAGEGIRRFVSDTGSLRDIAKPGVAENTSAFWITVSMSAAIFINVAVVLIATIITQEEITTPDFGDNLSQMFLFADAAVWEEIIARVLYIGVPMTILSLIVTKKKESLKCLLGGFGMSKAAVAFIIISGVIFGLAHYPGWEDQAWKVVGTGVMGMFLGYVFVRFGLYASILLHFINDYLSAFDWVGAGWAAGLVSLALLGIGLIATYYVVNRLWGSRGSIVSLPLFRNGYVKSDGQGWMSKGR